MTTERERKALQIAKSTFEHYTHSALDIAKQIIAMEREMAEDSGVAIPVKLQPAQGNIPNAEDLQPTPAHETKSIRIAGPLNYARAQAVELPADRVFEEVPY
jgi:hypothetical protein